MSFLLFILTPPLSDGVIEKPAADRDDSPSAWAAAE
jgi:hypothetical protein